MRNVLFPFDGSASAKRAIQYLLDLAGDYPNIQVHVINVQAAPKLYGDYVSSAMLEQLHAGSLQHAQEIAAEAAELLKEAGVRVAVHAMVGEVVDEIVHAAKACACDTVIMGTRGMSNLGNLLMGSVATRVVHGVPVPVLLVK